MSFTLDPDRDDDLTAERADHTRLLADIDADQLAGTITAQQAGAQRLGAWHDMNAELDQLKAEHDE